VLPASVMASYKINLIYKQGKKQPAPFLSQK
jgi:hypothetical protein